MSTLDEQLVGLPVTAKTYLMRMVDLMVGLAQDEKRETRRALRDVATALEVSDGPDAAVRLVRAGPAQDAYRASLLKSRDGLEATARKFDIGATEAKKFADTLLQIPAKREVQVSLKGAATATDRARALRDALLGIKNRSVTVDVAIRTANKMAANPGLDPRKLVADGGYIAGPGTSTSDSIPAYLSDGEYVVKAAAVSKYGARFFDQVNSMRFASGGMVHAAAQVLQHPNGELRRAERLRQRLGARRREGPARVGVPAGPTVSIDTQAHTNQRKAS